MYTTGSPTRRRIFGFGRELRLESAPIFLTQQHSLGRHELVGPSFPEARKASSSDANARPNSQTNRGKSTGQNSSALPRAKSSDKISRKSLDSKRSPLPLAESMLHHCHKLQLKGSSRDIKSPFDAFLVRRNNGTRHLLSIIIIYVSPRGSGSDSTARASQCGALIKRIRGRSERWC